MGRAFSFEFIAFFGLFSGLLLPVLASAVPTSLSVQGSFGAATDRRLPQAAFSVQSDARFEVSDSFNLGVFGRIDRPLNRYESNENFSIPKLSLSARSPVYRSQNLDADVNLVASALAPTRWSVDGAMSKFSIWTEGKLRSVQPFAVKLGLAPFLRANRYRLTAAGENLPRYGLTEKLSASYQWKRLSIEAAFLMEQSYGAVWHNDYATSESLSYQLTPSLSLGLSHELESSVVDASTGRAKPFQFFSDRTSFVSLFIHWEDK